MRADRPRPLVAEVAVAEDVGETRQVRGPIPVVKRGQALALVFRVGRGLVPAHAGHRIVAVALGEASELPGRGPRPSRPILELGHRLLEGEHTAVLDEGLLPELPPRVTRSLHELLELAVRHLAAVEPEFRKLLLGRVPELEFPARHQHHPSRGFARGDQPERLAGERGRGHGQLDGRVAGFLELDAKQDPRQLESLERRLAQLLPLGFGLRVRLPGDQRPRWLALHRRANPPMVASSHTFS